MQETTGTFRTSGWEEAAFSSVEGGPRLTRARVVNAFHGGVEGTGVLEYLMVYLDRGRGTFFGLEQVTGRLGSREGTFVLRHAGTFEGHTVDATLEVVDGSGTGELAGLTGRGSFTARRGVEDTPFTLRYQLG
ncbi:MAG TPA: DUF3224 domain-containing protein [Candidatus Dormibacteraeota bacterium]|nr:DUF3224 domain-containing protein [Candidatus Dormibacteraeota bacterium]